MKKIASNIGTISTIHEIKNALFGDWKSTTGCRYDVYAEDDGSVRVCKHKVMTTEAIEAASEWLSKNKAVYGSKTVAYTYLNGIKAIIVCAYLSNGKVTTGTAKFNEKDPYYSTTLGKALAYSRASGEKLPFEVAEYLGIQQ